MNLHNEIMNIPADPAEFDFHFSHAIAFKIGHREARHAAAELALKKDALIEKLLDALDSRNAHEYSDAFRAEYGL